MVHHPGKRVPTRTYTHYNLSPIVVVYVAFVYERLPDSFGDHHGWHERYVWMPSLRSLGDPRPKDENRSEEFSILKDVPEAKE